MNNVVNQVAYLRTSREFPENASDLTVEINRAYVDIANAVNNRIIGIFPVNRQAITGESWYLVKNQKQQTFRKVFTFGGTTAINHQIQVPDINQFTRCFGSYTNGTSSFGLIYATSNAISGQISFYLTKTQIIFEVGADAPSLSQGRIVLEWLSQV